MTITYGVLATLEAKPEKADELASFLEKGREIALAEEGTVTWYAFRIGPSVFGIFDTFEDESGRSAHLEGDIPRALEAVGDELLATPPVIELVDIVASKKS